MKMMKLLCKTCKNIMIVRDDRENHSWKYGQCGKCHYFGFQNKIRRNQNEKYLTRGKYEKIIKHKQIVTEQNIDLYCKISKIIRGKKCKPHTVLSTQFIHKEVLP